MEADESLTRRVSAAGAGDIPPVEEREMFGGRAFMVDGKLCVSVGNDRLMCRIDPATHDNVVVLARARSATPSMMAVTWNDMHCLLCR